MTYFSLKISAIAVGMVQCEQCTFVVLVSYSLLILSAFGITKVLFFHKSSLAYVAVGIYTETAGFTELSLHVSQSGQVHNATDLLSKEPVDVDTQRTL